MRSFAVSLFLCFLLAISTFAQNAPESPYCAQVTEGLNHGAALASFCNWVLSFDKRLPDIIGDQFTRRFHTDNGKDRKLEDTTSARIAYIAGRPRFTDVAINRVPVAQDGDLPELLKLHGAWSYGDYGTDIRLLFGESAHTHFAYDGETTWHDRRVIAFTYEVKAADNLRWEMKARVKPNSELLSTFPGYRGRILLDAHSLDLVHFERHTTGIEKGFPLRSGSNEVDYQRVPLGDGSTFVLPDESIVTFCHDDKHHHCEINDTTFENWQKFGVKSRILTGDPQK